MDMTLTQIWQMLIQDYAVLFWGTPFVVIGTLFIARQIFSYLFSLDKMVSEIRQLNGMVADLTDINNKQVKILKRQNELLTKIFNDSEIKIRLADDYFGPVNNHIQTVLEINENLERLVEIWE